MKKQWWPQKSFEMRVIIKTLEKHPAPDSMFKFSLLRGVMATLTGVLAVIARAMFGVIICLDRRQFAMF